MSYFISLILVLFVYMNCSFLLSLIKKRNDIADIAWGLGFVLLAWFSLFFSQSYGVKNIVITTLVTIWGTRLAWHIYLRNKKKSEDYRYLTWRKQWGKWFYMRSYFQVFILQGILLFLIVLPVLLSNKNTQSYWSWISILGIVIWIVGFLFEVIGDKQLARFVNNTANTGKLIDSGLWKYTRHPNYFGEITLWWGIWLIALSPPYNILSIVGPITITILIVKVSGIPMLEKKMSEHPDFAAYKKRTSILIPWFRKNI